MLLINKIYITLPFQGYFTCHSVSLQLHFSLMKYQSLREEYSRVKQSRFITTTLF